jgi:hypothetical protein
MVAWLLLVSVILGEAITACIGLNSMMTGDEITTTATININPSLNPDDLSDTNVVLDEFPFFINYRLDLIDPTYLQLETLVTPISHRFRLEQSKYPIICTILNDTRNRDVWKAPRMSQLGNLGKLEQDSLK